MKKNKKEKTREKKTLKPKKRCQFCEREFIDKCICRASRGIEQ